MKKLPIGISDFKKLIIENYYYVDKTLFIKDIVEDGSSVILIPRPRRFGKTLNMSILKYFYQKTEEDNKFLFENLNIQNHKEVMLKQGQYPVIYITFKDEKYSNFGDLKNGFKILIANLYRNHDYLLDSDKLSDVEKNEFYNILNKETDIIHFSKSLYLLSSYLYKHYNQKVVILIDEYDVPIQEGYMKEYYEEIIEIMRNFLSGGLKDNEYLEKCVLTGILRVARESIFSGLNNLKACTILRNQYSEYFGFLEEEVEEMLRHYTIEFEIDDIRNWYNGYIFGENVIYNPWSILNYIDNYKAGFKPYWVNTAECGLIKRLLAKGDKAVKIELEELIKGEELIKKIDEHILMGDVNKNTSSVWSFLLFSGYLKTINQELREGITYCSLQIPNKEVKSLYNQIVVSWFEDNLSDEKFDLVLNSLIKVDLETFEDILSEYIIKTSSYFYIGDESEKFYHAFVLGMLIGLKDKYEIKSNRESGYGRYDIMMIPIEENNPGIIIEFKKVNRRRKETLEIALEKALNQIKDMEYKQELISRGISEIVEIGIAFDGKEVLVGK